MPRIPRVQSQQGLPATSGGVFINNPNRGVGEAIAAFGLELTQAVEKREERQAKVAIYDAENSLRRASLEMYLGAQQEKLGKNALPDQETGYKGVFNEYDEFATREVGDRLGKIPPRFHQAARERLESVATGYRERFAIHQAAQEGEYRKQVLQQTLEGVNSEMRLVMGGGGSTEDLFAYAAQVEALITEEARGANVTTAIKAEKTNIVRQGIIAKADIDPAGAKKMLEDKRVIKGLEPSDKASLEDYVERKRIDQEVDTLISTLDAAPLDFAQKIELAGEHPDRQVRDRAVSELNHQRSQADRAKADRQATLITDVYDEIFAKDKPPTPAQVDRDPRFDILEPNQKLAIKSWLNKDADGSGKKAAQDARDFFLWTAAQRSVWSGGLNEDAVQKGVLEYLESGGERGIPIKYGKELYEDVAKAREAPQVGRAAGVLNNELELDRDDQAKFDEALYAAIRARRDRNDGQMPSYEEILEIGRKLAAPLRKDKWFQRPRYKDNKWLEAGGLGSEEDRAMAVVLATDKGWDQAVYDEESKMWYGRKGDRQFRFDPTSNKTFEFIPK
jgi:hypothetical protein